jgi:hypothetical protein
MTSAPEITDDAIRQHLLTKVAAFQSRSGMSLWKISEAAVSDSKFLSKVQRGGNFTVSTYQRVIDWVDRQESDHAA